MISWINPRTMIALKPFRVEDWKLLKKWTSNESELIQFAGIIFSFPVDQQQVETYLSDSNRTVFRIENEHQNTIGIAEISNIDANVAKLSRILIGEKSNREKGIGTELMTKLTEYAFYTLQKEKIILNVYSWNVGAISCYQKSGFSFTDKPIKLLNVGHEEWKSIQMEKVNF